MGHASTGGAGPDGGTTIGAAGGSGAGGASAGSAGLFGGGGSAGSFGGGSAGISMGGSAGTAAAGGAGGGCQASEFSPDLVPLDLYLMVDQSQSLSSAVPGATPSATWWQVAQQGLTSFVQDPRANGTGVGIQYFPFHGLTDPTNDPTTPTSSCYVPNYVTPEVEVGLLPGNASALVQSIAQHTPTTFTPTAAALTGALEHMQAWGTAHPGRQPAVVLVTDGFPTECTPQDPASIALIAQNAYQGTPRVLTFVVGLEDAESLANLDVIAKAGGTGQAYLINGGDIASQLVSALTTVTATPLSCAYPIPDFGTSGKIDLGLVAVTYAPSGGSSQLVPRLTNLGQCTSSGGWYFDAPPPASTKIEFCPATCQKLSAGTVRILYGCSVP